MGDFRMPSLGADMEEGTLLEWLVTPGDTVHRGDIVAVVDTTKSSVEIESFEDGVVEQLLAEPGTVVPVGGVLARFGELEHVGAAVSTPPAAAAAPAAPTEGVPAARRARSSPTPSTPVVASPLVRRQAAELGVDLDTVTGTGSGGRVLRHDVDSAAHREPPSGPEASAGAPRRPSPPRPPKPPRPRTSPPPRTSSRPRVTPLARRLAAEAGLDPASLEGSGPHGAVRADDVRAATRTTPPSAAPPRHREPGSEPAPPAATTPTGGHDMRAAIGALMARSKREIPHYYLSTTVDLHRTLMWLHDRNRRLEVDERLVPAAALLCATARAARTVPELNGTWVDGAFRPAGDVDLGLVVSLRSGGLLVPVIAGADSLSVEDLMARLKDLTRRARAGRLRGADLRPPSITVTNLGEQGVESVQGVVYPPQVALVGFGAVSERPWAVDGLIGVRPLVTATLAADHRASDAATGSRLLRAVDSILQRPEEL